MGLGELNKAGIVVVGFGKTHIPQVQDGDKDNIEAQAAYVYFQFYHKGLNRRTDDPVNSDRSPS
jgi:hypothetical protein